MRKFLIVFFVVFVCFFVSCKKKVPLDNLVPGKFAQQPSEQGAQANFNTNDKEKDETNNVLDTEEPDIRKASLEEKAELDTIYFDFDSSSIREQDKNVLVNNAKWLKENPNYKVLIAGHTDQRGTLKYNLGLGQDRASKVRHYLSYLGIAADRIATISYGKERLLVNENNEEAYAKNRRAEFFVYKN